MTVNEWKERVVWQLSRINDEAQKLPSNVSTDFKKQVQSMLEGAKSLVQTLKPPASTKAVGSRSLPEENALKRGLLATNWTELVQQFEEQFNVCESMDLIRNPKILEYFKSYQYALQEQIQQILKREIKKQERKLSPEMLSCLARVHEIGRRLMPQKPDIATTLPAPASASFSGLPQNRNSCYLAAALQFLRFLSIGDFLKQFLGHTRDVNNFQSTKIQRCIYDILELMSSKQPIPVAKSEELRELLSKADIIKGTQYAQNDAAEVVTKILDSMGLQLPVGKIQQRTKKTGEADFGLPLTEDYRLSLNIPENAVFDTAAGVRSITQANLETVESFGEVERRVTSLPAQMFVTFTCHGQFSLRNHEEFQDPLNPGYYYQLVFGMENNPHFGDTLTSGHWISHIRGDRNQWIVANDDWISERPEAPQQLRYGYYIRRKREAS